MARTPAVLGQAPGIGERIGIAAMCRSFGRLEIERALRASGRETLRRRELSAELTIYYVIAMTMLMHVNLREVLRCLFEGLRAIGSPATIKVTGKSGISQARSRLGAEPLRHLYEATAVPIAKRSTRGAWYGPWRLIALDGSTLDVPDETANRIEFGGPTTFNDSSPFPQIRFATLAEIGTRVLFSARMAAYGISEVELAREVVLGLKPGMLCIADRGFFGFDMLERVRKTGAQFLFRARKDNVLPASEVLADGSYLSDMNTWRRANRGERGPAMTVRVIKYRLDGVREPDNVFTLVTTLLDPIAAPASDLARLYQERWEIETAFDELKTHLRGARLCLRSKTPALVRQEFYGLMLAHYAVRTLIHEAALKVDDDPDRISFTHSVNVIRRKIGQLAAVSPSEID